MIQHTRFVSRSVFRTLALTALGGLALAATACADSTGPSHKDCVLINNNWVCFP